MPTYWCALGLLPNQPRLIGMEVHIDVLDRAGSCGYEAAAKASVAAYIFLRVGFNLIQVKLPAPGRPGIFGNPKLNYPSNLI